MTHILTESENYERKRTFELKFDATWAWTAFVMTTFLSLLSVELKWNDNEQFYSS